MDKNTIFIKMPDIITMDLPGGFGVKHRNHLHRLNSTAFGIFNLCDGNPTVLDIENTLSEQFPDENIHDTIIEFFEQLLSLDLIKEKNGNDFVHILRKH